MYLPDTSPARAHAVRDGREGDILSAAKDLISRHSVRTALTLGVILATLAGGTVIVHLTGGTGYAFPYVLFVPILIAAGVFGLPGAVLSAVAAGILLGPYMPLDVARGIDQSMQNWLTRLAFFVGLGTLAGGMFQRLRFLARRDRRTGLPNQTALEQRLEVALMRAQFARQPVSVFLIRALDLEDALDAVGADAGDELVLTFALRLREELPMERVFRYSASTLALIVESRDDTELRHCARRVQDIAEETLTVRDVPVRIEICVGIASSGEAQSSDRPHELIRRARIALGAAWERGQDYCFYSMRYERRTAETIRLIARLREGLDAGEFELHYQPKIALSGAADRVAGAEGLIRWRDPGRGLIPPARFIPKVEQTRLIVPLTRFIARTAGDFVRAHPGLRLSINLAPRSLYDEELIADLVVALEQGQLEPERIEFEITETALMTEPEDAVRTLQRLRRLGVGVSIDDFGTGYASFEYLRRLPVTGVKIDQVFVRDIEHDSKTRNLVRCMIDVGHSLGLEVTAEGAETAGTIETLRGLDCDLVQGFFYTGALPAAELQDWTEGFTAAPARTRPA